MALFSWLRQRNPNNSGRRSYLERVRFRPCLETLEDRMVPSAIGIGSTGNDPDTTGSTTQVNPSLATDSSGNVYMTGSAGSYSLGTDGTTVITNAANFNPNGTTTVTPGGFVAKYSSSGALDWAVPVGQGTVLGGNPLSITTFYSGYSSENAIAVGSGNVFVAGEFYGTINFATSATSTTSLTAGAEGSFFVAQLDASTGYCNWAQGMTGDFGGAASGVAVDGSGNAYVTGKAGPKAAFDGANLPLSGASTFIVKISSGGTFQWADAIQETSGITGQGRGVWGKSIALDGTGNPYIAGNYIGTVDFDPGTATYKLTSTNRKGGYPTQNIFVMKLDTSGKFAWADSMGSASS